MFKLAKYTVIKSSIIFKVFLEKILKLSLCHQFLAFEATFILILLLNHYSVEKQGGIKDFVRLVGPSGFKIFFILLAKTIAI